MLTPELKKKCINCDNMFTYCHATRNYCSKECSKEWNRAEVKNNNRKPRNRTDYSVTVSNCKCLPKDEASYGKLAGDDFETVICLNCGKRKVRK
jgi:hypothetical protein